MTAGDQYRFLRLSLEPEKHAHVWYTPKRAYARRAAYGGRPRTRVDEDGLTMVTRSRVDFIRRPVSKRVNFDTA